MNRTLIAACIAGTAALAGCAATQPEAYRLGHRDGFAGGPARAERYAGAGAFDRSSYAQGYAEGRALAANYRSGHP